MKPILIFPKSSLELDGFLADAHRDGLVIVQLSAMECVTVKDMFEEFSRALRFPDYFGRNWDAFDELLSDPVELDFRSGIVLVIDCPSRLLVDEPEKRPMLGQSIRSAQQSWANPVNQGGWWGHAALAFITVLAVGEHENKATLDLVREMEID